MIHTRYLLVILMLSLIACEDKSKSSSDTLYENCVNKLSDDILNSDPKMSAPNRQEIAESGCTSIKNQCDQEPGGVVCRKMEEEYSY